MLPWRTLFRSVRAEHATITGQWLKSRVTSDTFIEEEAGVNRHLFLALKSTARVVDRTGSAYFRGTHFSKATFCLLSFRSFFVELQNRSMLVLTLSSQPGINPVLLAFSIVPHVRITQRHQLTGGVLGSMSSRARAVNHYVSGFVRHKCRRKLLHLFGGQID